MRCEQICWTDRRHDFKDVCCSYRIHLVLTLCKTLARPISHPSRANPYHRSDTLLKFSASARGLAAIAQQEQVWQTRWNLESCTIQTDRKLRGTSYIRSWPVVGRR
jgi:hypothetical protein